MGNAELLICRDVALQRLNVCNIFQIFRVFRGKLRSWHIPKVGYKENNVKPTLAKKHQE